MPCDSRLRMLINVLICNYCQIICRPDTKLRHLVSIMLLSFFSLYVLFLWNSTILPVNGGTLSYLKLASTHEQSLPQYFLSLQQPQPIQQQLEQVSSNDTITSNPNANASTTSSPAGGIQIAYPKKWIVNDLGNGTVRFSTPLRTDLMRFTINVVNLPSSLPKNMTLDKIVELNLNQLKTTAFEFFINRIKCNYYFIRKAECS